MKCCYFKYFLLPQFWSSALKIFELNHFYFSWKYNTSFWEKPSFTWWQVSSTAASPSVFMTFQFTIYTYFFNGVELWGRSLKIRFNGYWLPLFSGQLEASEQHSTMTGISHSLLQQMMLTIIHFFSKWYSLCVRQLGRCYILSPTLGPIKPWLSSLE